MIRFTWRSVLFVALAGGSLLADGTTPIVGPFALVSTAEAVVGRPATPMSYAGVARRTTRRAVGAGAVAAPVVVAPAPVYVAPAPVYVAPPVVVAPVRTCVQAVDPYGRIYTRC